MVKPLQRRRRQLQQFWAAQQTNPELAEQAELRLLNMEAKQAKAAETIEQQAVERETERRAAAHNTSVTSRRSTEAPSTPMSAQTLQVTAWNFSSLPVLPGLPSPTAPNASYVLDCLGSRWRCLLGVSA
jgi:hypothetical protein